MPEEAAPYLIREDRGGPGGNSGLQPHREEVPGGRAVLRGEVGREPLVQTGLEFYEIQEVAGLDRGVLDPRFTAYALDLEPFHRVV